MINIRAGKLMVAVVLAGGPMLIACSSGVDEGKSGDGRQSRGLANCKSSIRTPNVSNFCEVSFYELIANPDKYYGKKVSFHAFFKVGPRDAVAAALPISLENAEFSEIIFARNYLAEEFASELRPGVTYRGRMLGELAPSKMSGKPHHAAVLISPYIFYAHEVDPADAGEAR